MQAATTEAYRTLDLQPGADLGSVRQAAWATYRQRTRIDALPEELSVVLVEISRFVDPIGRGDDVNLWRPEVQSWE